MQNLLIVNHHHPEESLIASASQVLSQGGLVVLPTETVYGLAADPTNPEAMSKLYEAKGRHEKKPIAFFIRNMAQITELSARLPVAAQHLARAYWPGPLTLVLPAPDGQWLGFRMPRHEVPLRLLRAFGRPLAVTSANRSGEPEAMTAREAWESLGDQVGLYLDAGRPEGGVPSTVVRVDDANIPHILREGAISASDIFSRIAED